MQRFLNLNTGFPKSFSKYYFTNWASSAPVYTRRIFACWGMPQSPRTADKPQSHANAFYQFTFSSLNPPHIDEQLLQVPFSEVLFAHYSSFLFLQYPFHTAYPVHLLSLYRLYRFNPNILSAKANVSSILRFSSLVITLNPDF